MSRTAGYGAACAGLTSIAVLGLWPLLDGAGRTGILVAAAVALPCQVVAFAILQARFGQWNRFLAAWVGGILARFALVFAAAVAVAFTELPAAPTLLGMAGFLFAMLLLEPVFVVHRDAQPPTLR